MTDFRKAAKTAARLMDEKKAEDIIIMDVSKIASFTQFIILATFNSSTHIQSAQDILKKGFEIQPLHREGDVSSGWVLVDYGEMVVNLFNKETRDFYCLDKLWAESKPVKWNA